MSKSRVPAMVSAAQNHRIQANLAIRHGQIQFIEKLFDVAV
jgi:hypothetical protein